MTSPTDAAQSEDLHQRLQALEHQLRTIQNERDLLQNVIDQLPYAVYWKSTDLTYLGCNQRFAADLDMQSPAQVIGKREADLPWQPSEAEHFEAIDQRILDSASPVYDDSETVIYPNATQEWFETYKQPLFNRDHEVIGVMATYSNITPRKQAEATIQAQAQLLQELSTPIIPITDTVLVMPVIGAIDTRRAHQILEAMLEHVANSKAKVVVLDITGVPIVDTQVAHALIQSSQAVQLVGARVVLTGIRPEVAQAIVGLGIELKGIVTYSSLQQGLLEIFRNSAKARRKV